MWPSYSGAGLMFEIYTTDFLYVPIVQCFVPILNIGDITLPFGIAYTVYNGNKPANPCMYTIMLPLSDR